MPTNQERPIVRLTENNLPNDGDNDWNLQSWKKQRRGPVAESIIPEEIYRAAAAAWSRFRGKLEYIESNDIPKSFTRQHDRRFFYFGHMVEDLKFEHDFYCPKPKMVNGEPLWEKVVPYNACYLPNHDDRIDHRELNPVEMWLEDRWILTRRIYGSELTQKLFMQCWNWIYACNDIKGYYFHQIQDAIVSQLFNQDPRTFFKQTNKSTWIEYWDGTCDGYISQNTAHYLCQKINVLGPIAAICGRDFELFIVSEFELNT